MQTEKLLLPRWIIPLEGDTEVLENYGLAIENGLSLIHISEPTRP